MSIYKNIASQKIAVFAYDTSADAPKTGDAANISAQISKDGGATAATNDVAPTELDATDAKGIYIFDMTQAETNADMVILSAVSATANITLEPMIIYTEGVSTEARLAELDAANLPADLDTVKTATVTTIPATLGTPTDTDLATDIANVDGNTSLHR